MITPELYEKYKKARGWDRPGLCGLASPRSAWWAAKKPPYTMKYPELKDIELDGPQIEINQGPFKFLIKLTGDYDRGLMSEIGVFTDTKGDGPECIRLNRARNEYRYFQAYNLDSVDGLRKLGYTKHDAWIRVRKEALDNLRQAMDFDHGSWCFALLEVTLVLIGDSMLPDIELGNTYAGGVYWNYHNPDLETLDYLVDEQVHDIYNTELHKVYRIIKHLDQLPEGVKIASEDSYKRTEANLKILKERRV